MQSLSYVNKSVKFTFNEQIRRFTLTPENQTLDQLVKVIRSLIHKDEMTLVIKYFDDENEWVTIDRDIEFQTALTMSEGVLRLTVSEGVTVESAQGVKDTESAEVPVKGRNGRGNRGGFKGRGKRGGCGRGRKGNRNDATEVNDDCSALNSNEAATEPVWHKYKEGRGKGKLNGKKGKCGRKFKEESTSDSIESVDPSLTVEELKAQIQKLVESQEVIRNNLKEANEKLAAKKSEIVQLRQNPDPSGEQLATLKSEIADLKAAKLAVRGSLWSTKREIGQLRQAIRAKKTEAPSDV